MANSSISPRKVTLLLIGIIMLSLIFHVVADRKIPSTDMSRVRSYVVPVAPLVSGLLKDVVVVPNQEVQTGDLLAVIDPTDFQLQLERAELALRIAGQEIGGQTAAITAAQARVSQAQATLENIRQQYYRVALLVEKKLLPVADKDKAQSELANAEANVQLAQAELERAQQTLGQQGENNAKFQSALRDLQAAQLNLERTRIRAPSHGGVTNFRLEQGFYAHAGQPLMTFLAVDDVWIEAYFRENSLEHIRPGDKVELTLDFAPGRVFKGEVVSSDYGVNWGQNEQPGKLAQITPQNGWLRNAQYFPVTIKFTDNAAFGLRRIGGQADVIVYTQNSNFLFDALGRFWIRLVSLLSYVR